MRRTRWIFIGALGTAAILLASHSGVASVQKTKANQKNSCVSCHSKADTTAAFPRWAQDQFLHWYGAAHGKAGVTCDECHGGDSSASNVKKAHAGVISSHDAKSPVYFSNLPKTCGTCHADVSESFGKSKHFEMLVKDRRAPSCTTCHGFEMDVGAVSPSQIGAKCNLCHNNIDGKKPEVAEKAHALLARVESIQNQLLLSELAIKMKDKEKRNTAEAKRLVEQARKRLAETTVYWHTFDLDTFAARLDAAEKIATQARTAALSR